MSAPQLPRDLQGRLDVLLAKPLLRRAPALAQAIEILVRNAYERQPPSSLSGAQRGLLAQLQAPIETSAWKVPGQADAIAAARQLAAGENKDGVL